MNKLLGRIYKTRYSDKDESIKLALWKVLCRDFLQKFVSDDASVLDIAAGHCEFINSIHCRHKYAVDINLRIRKFADKGVKVYLTDAQKLPRSLRDKIDVVFMGCFLEHLPSKQSIINVLTEIKRVLKREGKLLILNPNIRFSTSDYWDYFDHLTPVSDRSVTEVLTALGYQIDLCIPRFTPNTIKDSLPKSPFLLRLYLHMPFMFPLFGKQMFIVARKG